MKKAILMVAMIMVVGAGVSHAAVVGTDHDLSTGTALRNTDTVIDGQTCIFCHTPHGGVTKAPLWNRAEQPAGTTYTKYSSSTMDAPQPTDAQIIGSVSGACLSCHDGTVAVDNLLNVNGASHPPSIAFTVQGAADATYGNDPGGGTNNIMTGGIPFMGTNLSNDHPITIDYGLAGPDLRAETACTVVNGTITIPLYGANCNVECGSCHNPHDNTNGNFLRYANTGSQLCTTCHLK